ncbi:calcineurin b-like protein 1 isoform 1 [Plasmopara halstedii]|uniref:Calcineurin b-like protein 1 isoform 1 n=1 Tax=Plasmopara halstedii TaxID=4781 RepID=A0A0N7L4Q0_PLAHL|nr:calcineurin b-like protein 1 isoform 1 [Plasmopara halstedii]CEG39291.1 calcineurin b-like protein 1 isoform 1 [Plasmopara halstedii]|eukprot:XP_024575660.1 calcineurin b-like protein 1 isoform 1 [Plasmopara halstedii]
MGSKQAKQTPPSSSSTSRSNPPSASSNFDPPAAVSSNSSHSRSVPPPLPAQSLLETKLAEVEVSAVFSQPELLIIRKHLAAVLDQHENDAVVIPKDEFFRFLAGGDGSTSSLYVNRLYAIFDMTKKGHVTFEDLMKGLSLLSQKATREQKLMLSFYLLDPEGTGFITKKMTTELLRSCLAECNELEISLSEKELAYIVDNTFLDADLDRNGVIDLNEYQALDAKHPGLFDFLTVDAFGVLSHLEKVHSMSITVPQ